jgi:hypothetical protein
MSIVGMDFVNKLLRYIIYAGKTMKIQVGYNHTNARFIKMINLMNGDVLISFQKALITCTKCM